MFVLASFENIVKLAPRTNSQLLRDNSSMGQLAISFQTQLVTKVWFNVTSSYLFSIFHLVIVEIDF